MENTNLMLSAEERSIVQNASFILTKNRIIKDVYEMFGEMANEDQCKWEILSLPVSATEPKISRGENLSGLPWVMLDQPRFFTESDVLAIRVLFWWGHFFSMTLHLKGSYQSQLAESVINGLSLFQEKGWSIGVGEDPWDHKHDNGVYEPMTSIKTEIIKSLLQNKNHIRISKRYSFDHWDELISILKEDRSMLLKILKEGFKPL